MALSPETRRRIFEEERFRVEVRERARDELRLRRQGASLLSRILLMAGLFALSYLASNLFLARVRAVPEPIAPVQPTVPAMTPSVLDAIERALKPDVGAEVCARMVGRKDIQVKATIELARDTPRDTARRLAMARAKAVGATLRQHGLALPAYVEVFSPQRWYGVAVYDRDTLRISWDPCPGRCEQEGTRYVRRCAQAPVVTDAR